MVTLSRTADVPADVPPSAPLAFPHPPNGLFANIDHLEAEEHVLVLGRDGMNLMCALLRAGAPRVTHLCSYERLEAHSVSLAIIPTVTSRDWLDRALPTIRRALLPNGRLMVSADPLPSVHSDIRRCLQRHAFAAIRTTRSAGRLIVSAEVASYGLRQCA